MRNHFDSYAVAENWLQSSHIWLFEDRSCFSELLLAPQLPKSLRSYDFLDHFTSRTLTTTVSVCGRPSRSMWFRTVTSSIDTPHDRRTLIRPVCVSPDAPNTSQSTNPPPVPRRESPSTRTSRVRSPALCHRTQPSLSRHFSVGVASVSENVLKGGGGGAKPSWISESTAGVRGF